MNLTLICLVVCIKAKLSILLERFNISVHKPLPNESASVVIMGIVQETGKCQGSQDPCNIMKLNHKGTQRSAF